MKNKLMWLLPMMLVFASFAMAAPYNLSILTPAADNTPRLNGVTKFDANVSINSGVNTITNTSFAIDGVIIGWNNTKVNNGTQAVVSLSYDTRALADGVGKSLTITVYPVITAAVNNGSSSPRLITIDNTIPSVTLTSPTDGAKVKKGTSFTGTVAYASGCELQLSYNGGQTFTNNYTMTLSGTTCTYTPVKGVPPEGAVVWRIKASDGTNTTNSATRQAVIDLSSSSSTNQVEAIEVGSNLGQTTVTNQDFIKKLVVILLIGGAIYIVMNNKKFK